MFNFLWKTKLLHQISPVLNRVILALISCYLSLMRYMNLLVCGLKLEASSLIYQKHLIRCSMNLLNLLQDFLKEKKSVALNGKVSQWKNINTGVPQVSIHVPLFFLIYINEGLTANAKLFADNTSLFSVVHDT